MQSEKIVGNTRENNFNIIRFVAAVMVVYGHMYHLIGSYPKPILGTAVSSIGVKIFFLISGYLILQSYLRDSNLVRYGIKRFFRIIPGLAGVVLFSIFIVGPLFTSLPLRDYFMDPSLKTYARNILLFINYNLPGVFAENIYPNAVNGSLWSLPVEVFMYLMVPIVFFVFSKFNKKKTIIFCAIFCEIVNIARQIFYPELRVVIYGSNVIDALALIPYFFVGMMFNFAEIKKYLNLQLATGIMIIGMMLDVNAIKGELILFFVLPYFIFSFVFVENPVFKKCFAKNDYSYGMYLYGFVVQQMLVNKLAYLGFSLNVFMVISTIATLVFAMLSWHLIEKPCQKIGKRLLKTSYVSKLKCREISGVN